MYTYTRGGGVRMCFGNDVSATCTCVLAYATAAIPQQNETADAAPATCKADATALKIHIRPVDNKYAHHPFSHPLWEIVNNQFPLHHSLRFKRCA